MTEIRPGKGLTEGLGGECLVPSGTVYQRDTEPLHPYFTGSLTTISNIRGAGVVGFNYVSGPTLIGTNISGTNIRVGAEGLLHSVAIGSSTATITTYGAFIRAGSVLTTAEGSIFTNFPQPFTNSGWYIMFTGSQTAGTSNPYISGAKHASGGWVVGNVAARYDWIAVNI